MTAPEPPAESPASLDARPVRSRRRWLFFALLAALVIVFFRAVIIGSDVFFFRDFGLFFYPKRLLAAAAVRNLEVPLWESLSCGGIPVLGTYQSAVFYPLSLIYYVLPMPRSFMLFVVVHFFITGAGAFYMLRAWGVRRAAASVGALLWTFAPSFVSVVDNVSFLTSLAWLPWCLAFSRQLFIRPAFGPFICLAAAFAMALLAGAPEPVIFIAAALALAAVFAVARAAQLHRLKESIGRLALVLAALLVAALLSGVELVPFFYHLRYSERAESIPLKEASSWSMAPSDLILWMLPRFGLYPERGGIFWAGQRWLKSVYLGAAVPFLILWTLVLVRRKRNVFFAVLAMLFVLLALGSSSPLWRLCYSFLPGFSLVRYPVKFFLPAAFAASVLAAFAVDDVIALCRRRQGLVRVLFVVMGAAGVLCILAGMALSLWPDFARAHILPATVTVSGGQAAVQGAQQLDATRWSLTRSGVLLVVSALALSLSALFKGRTRFAAAGAALGAVLVADVFIYGGSLNPVTAPDLYTVPPAHLSQVDTRPGGGRVFMTDGLAGLLTNVRLARFGGAKGLADFLASTKGPEYASPDAITRWASWAAGRSFASLDELDRYLASNYALRMTETAQYEFYKEAFYPNTNLLYRVPVANTGEVIKVKWSAALWNRLWAAGAAAQPQMERLFAVSAVSQWTRDSSLFRITPVASPVPRAFLVTSFVAAADAVALDMVTSADFDPRLLVVLDEADAAEAAAFVGASPAPVPGTVEWLFDSGNAQVIRVNSPQPALLYVADNFYPSIRATVDRVPAPIFRANYAFHAVPVPAGVHTVEFVYRPVELYLGLSATFVGAAFLAAAGAFLMYRRFFAVK